MILKSTGVQNNSSEGAAGSSASSSGGSCARAGKAEGAPLLQTIRRCFSES